MGKYRLKSRQAGSVITLMEIDTESRAWYIKADHKEAALKAVSYTHLTLPTKLEV